MVLVSCKLRQSHSLSKLSADGAAHLYGSEFPRFPSCANGIANSLELAPGLSASMFNLFSGAKGRSGEKFFQGETSKPWITLRLGEAKLHNETRRYAAPVQLAFSSRLRCRSPLSLLGTCGTLCLSRRVAFGRWSATAHVIG